jgi:hypothetical protein
MRRIRYTIAASLDGYIAGPNGEYDWIVQDPEEYAIQPTQPKEAKAPRRPAKKQGGGR